MLTKMVEMVKQNYVNFVNVRQFGYHVDVQLKAVMYSV